LPFLFLVFLGLGWDWIHLARRPLIGPRVLSSRDWWMMMSVGQSVEWLAGETEVLGGNLPSATLSTTNPTWPYPGSNPVLRCGKPATNQLPELRHVRRLI
jgi:hypothetical protein